MFKHIFTFSISALFVLSLVSAMLVQPSYAQTTPTVAEPTRNPSPDSNFSTDLVTTYRVNEGGRTRVEHTVTITNLKPLFTVSRYALQVNTANISDVRVYKGLPSQTNETNEASQIQFQTVSTDSFSNIALDFSDQIVGQGKQRIFTISYTDPDSAIISGQVLELAVPRIQNKSAYDSYTVHLITPIRYGTPSKVNPTQHSSQLTEEGFKTTFSTDPRQVSTIGLSGRSGEATQAHFEGVNAIFGSEQLFDITLQYHLENTHSAVRLAQVALPPDTQYQRLIYSQLDPMPAEIEQDKDGNWIATYRVPANSTLLVRAEIQAKLTLEPDTSVSVPQPISAHIQSNDYWPINSSLIREYAKEHTTPRDIYTFTTETLSYDYERATAGNLRLGAEAILKNPIQALCQEFTDVFISLARANNIPARRLTGYAHTENRTLRPLSFVEDVLHSWPEYFNSETGHWTPVDPTWGNTSGGINYFDQLDLNHIVFAINGESSQRPYPAGSYKLTESESKDVEISFGTIFSLPEAALTFDSYTGPSSWLPFLQTPQILISNQTGAAQYAQIIELTSDDPQVSIWSVDQEEARSEQVKNIKIDTILPFETEKKDIVVLDTQRLIPGQGTIHITHLQNQDTNENKTTTVTTIIYPYFWRWFFNPFVVVGVVVGSVGLAVFTGSVLVLKQKNWKPLTNGFKKLSGLIRRESKKP
jgi:hypothetical protein